MARENHVDVYPEVFQLVKPAADHLPDPEGTLSSKLPEYNKQRPPSAIFQHVPPRAAFKRKNYYRSRVEN